MTELCVQERLAPNNRCFGCGPANAQGLRIRSFPSADRPNDTLVCDWTPSPHHEAFGNVLNGGIIGTLLDCHSNWAAAWYLMQRDGSDKAPPTVTMDFHVRLKRPTPTDAPVHLVACAVAADPERKDRVTVEATLEAGGKVTATCLGHFLAVPPGHPAYEQR